MEHKRGKSKHKEAGASRPPLCPKIVKIVPQGTPQKNQTVGGFTQIRLPGTALMLVVHDATYMLPERGQTLIVLVNIDIPRGRGILA